MILVITTHGHQLWQDALGQTALPTLNNYSEITDSAQSHCITSPVAFDDIESLARLSKRLVITYLSPDIRIAELLGEGKELNEALAVWKDETLKLLSVHKMQRREISLLNLEQLTQVTKQGFKNLQKIGWPLKTSVPKVPTTTLRVIAIQALHQDEELCQLTDLLFASSYSLSSKPLTLNLEEILLKFRQSPTIKKDDSIELSNSSAREQLLLNQLFIVQEQVETSHSEAQKLRKSSEFLTRENKSYRRKISELNKAAAVNQAKIDSLTLQLIKIHSSAAWKITKPIRVLDDKVSSRSKKRLLKENVALLSDTKFFDESWYLENNSDVQSSGINAAEHYLLYGAKEGRNPSKYFDTRWYLNKYSDVANSGLNPLVHFLKYGYDENRIPYPIHAKKNPSLK